MISWSVLESIYFALGGGFAMATADAHSARVRCHVTGFDHAAAFVVVFGTIMLWPALVALAIGQGPRK